MMIASLQSCFVTWRHHEISEKKHLFSSEQTCWCPILAKGMLVGSRGFQSTEPETHKYHNSLWKQETQILVSTAVSVTPEGQRRW